ncbi:MAG: LITAF-like zinc ribbon domain-containing protein [Pirellulaceae bacterium]
MDAFDPYYKWLGIPPEEQPPNHYRLLGLRIFEQDSDVIESAAEQRMMLLRSRQSGPNASACQRLLNEIAAAMNCLLDRETRTQYNAGLQGDTNERALAPPTSAPGSAIPLPTSPSPDSQTPDSQTPSSQSASSQSAEVFEVEQPVASAAPAISPPEVFRSSPPPVPPPIPTVAAPPRETDDDIVDAVGAAPPVHSSSPDSWHVQTPDGSYWGPASRDELDAWAAEGRIAPGSYLLPTGSDEWIDAGRILHLQQTATPAPQPYQHRQHGGGFQCPHCGAPGPPLVQNVISGAGWAVFVVLLIFLCPLCFLGLLITEPRRKCSHCGYPV